VASPSRFCEKHTCTNHGCWRPIANVFENNGCWIRDEKTASCKGLKLYERVGLERERDLVLDKEVRLPLGDQFINTSLRKIRYDA
jgi:hypothetical protein